MNPETKHVPTPELDGRLFARPWFVVPHGFEGCGIHAKDGTVIIARGLGPEMAAFIVRAVNAHDELLKTLGFIIGRLQRAEMYSGPGDGPSARLCFMDALRLAQAAIAKAKDK